MASSDVRVQISGSITRVEQISQSEVSLDNLSMEDLMHFYQCILASLAITLRRLRSKEDKTVEDVLKIAELESQIRQAQEKLSMINLLLNIQQSETTPLNIQQSETTPLIASQESKVPPSSEISCKTVISAFVLIILYVIGFGSLITGAVHYNHCPIQSGLPKVLLAFGGILTLHRILNCVYDIRSVCNDESSEDGCSEDGNTGVFPVCLKYLNVLFILGEFIMFLAVCGATWNIHPVFGNPLDKNYCDYTFYKIMHYGTYIGISFYGICIFVICCC